MSDNALDAMPRIIPEKEYDLTLKAGVEQRAQALLAFLKDHYSGERSYAKKGIIPANLVSKIIKRNKEQAYEGLIPPEQIRFMYGPDIIRDKTGTWRVIEDNVGFLGGLGDLRLAQKHMEQKNSRLTSSIRYRSSENFYSQLSEQFKAQAKNYGGKAVLYMTPPYSDYEDRRLKAIMADYGIETVSTYSNLQFKINDQGVFLYDRTLDKPEFEKVGFLFLNGEHTWLDPSHTASYEKLVLEEAQDHLSNTRLKKSIRQELLNEIKLEPHDFKKINSILNKSNLLNSVTGIMKKSKHFHGLTEAILNGKVGANYSPGIDFVGDKEFYLYVEKLIKYYLNKTPILKNIPTQKFSHGASNLLNKKIFAKVFRNLKGYVIKPVDGRGGDDVFVGPKVSKIERQTIMTMIKEKPSQFISQTYKEISRLNDLIVDMRLFAYVTNQKNILVADTSWGRGLPANGNGKVNLSDKGREITVLVRESSTKSMCKMLFLSH